MTAELSKLRFLESIFGKSIYSRNSHEASFHCPYCHHHKKKLAINLETDKYHCWVCSKGGHSLDHLIKQNTSDQRLAEYRQKYGKIKFKKSQEQIKITLPEYTFLLDAKDNVIGKRAYDYLVKSRQINPEDILKYKIGVSLDDKNYGGIVFPSFDRCGYLNYYIIRNLHHSVKYCGPAVPKEYKNQIIINELNIDWIKPIILVEGFIDAIKTGESNVIPLCGSYFSKSTKLFNEITKNKTQVYLALDKDAKKKAMKIAHNLIANDVDVAYVEVDDYEDIGSMPYGVFTKYLENATMVNEEFLFRQKMKEMLG